MITPESNQQTQHLTFHLAGEEYAVGILKVKEIIEYGTLTRVPACGTNSSPASIRLQSFLDAVTPASRSS